ncbi:TolB family protein [Nocardioides pelophilus]|uniref:TolB family protein n=1 Tax=Nocardioides pelophilus TaxID=2172019 RepID=UPI0015FF4388|nr:hypothetical protein [Nocardioides pelophilus]
MSLHDSLRELVAVRGAGVVDEAEEFRGALDDFLAEDEATVGEINLLVDAVRLGAVRRVLDVLDHGAAPEAAVREAGAALARDRGTDDPARSCWALAALCFALGKVDEELVRLFRADAGTVSAPQPPTAPHGRAPAPVDPPQDVTDRAHTPVLGEDSVSSRPTSTMPPDLGPHSTSPKPTPPETAAVQQPAPPYVPPVIPEERRSSKAGVFLLVVLVALILGGLVAAGFILLRSGDDPTASDDASDSGEPTRTRDPKKPDPVLSDDEMLVPYRVGEGADAVSMIYAVNIDGTSRPITGGPVHVLPTVSPDRRTMTFGQGPVPFVQIRWDLESAGFEPFFPDAGPCAHALRPGWSLDGEQVALVCTGNDKEPDGIFVAGADGSDPQLVVDDPLVAGSPTWVSDTEFIFGLKESDADDAPVSFWRGYADGRSAEPFDVGVSEGQVSHVDWSPEAEKLLFLVSSAGPDADQVGSVWTVNADGSDPQVVANGLYAHPVWSPDGRSIGVTVVDLEAETEVLGYVDLDDAGAPDAAPHIIENPPAGEVGIPVWGTR